MSAIKNGIARAQTSDIVIYVSAPYKSYIQQQYIYVPLLLFLSYAILRALILSTTLTLRLVPLPRP